MSDKTAGKAKPSPRERDGERMSKSTSKPRQDSPVSRTRTTDLGWTITVGGEIKDEHKVRACLALLGHSGVIPTDILEEIRREERDRKERAA
jgi:hypothetical protein